MENSRKRKAITLETKYQVISKRAKGEKPSDLMQEYGLASSTISTILKQKEKIIAEYESNEDNGGRRNQKTTKIKPSSYKDIDSAVEEWFRQTITIHNVVIGGPEIQAQAMKYAGFLSHPEFKASNGWLQRFRERNSISFKTIVGEAGLVDKVVTDHYLNEVLPGLLACYEPQNIYNADETALFYRAQPAKTMIYKNMACNSTKQSKERLSLLLTANMDGSDKLKPLVIGKSVNPRCFKNINKNNLPAIYRANTKGWMTGVIFKEWLYKLDKRMKHEKRQILMFVDNFSGHSPNKNEVPYVLTNIKLLYFPANCTSVIQPMDQGIINAFKIRYRTHIVRRRIQSIEYGGDEEEVTINVLDAINYLSDAWDATTRTTIVNCYRKAGFRCARINVDLTLDDEEDSIAPVREFTESCNHLNRISNYEVNPDEYLAIDSILPFAGVLTDEEIVAQYMPLSADVQVEAESSDEEDEQEPVSVSKAEARKHLDALKLYFLQSAQDSSDTLKLIKSVEKKLEEKIVQSNITSFFSLMN